MGFYMAGVRFGIGEEVIGGPRPEAHGGAKMKPGKVGGAIGVGLGGYPLLYGMIDAKGYLDGRSMASGNQGGYRFKDYLEAVTFVGQPHGYGTDCDFTAEISASVPFPYNNTPLVSSRPAAIPPPLPSTEMLVGPHPPTHASCLFRDAMERRGRSRAIPTTAAIRKSHHHQRQLYYSHYSINPSPSRSPVRSP